MSAPQDAYTAYEQHILDAVRAHGWFCTAVTADPERDVPGFAYSVGFTATLRQPEVIVFGLPRQLMHGLLWDVFHALQGGRILTDGDAWSGLLKGYDCIVRQVHPSHLTPDHFNSALWHHGEKGGDPATLEAFQLVWPSLDNHLPWDPACPADVRAVQTALWAPADR